MEIQFGGVAQLGEHLLCKQGVIGSNPFASTNLFGSRSDGIDEGVTEKLANSAYGLIFLKR